MLSTSDPDICFFLILDTSAMSQSLSVLSLGHVGRRQINLLRYDSLDDSGGREFR